ncbi:hypothetical protein SAMN03159341_11886 [Paenibacillus sp. 1_12]|nr:hypothetical protein SAMN03159341_11886 [Paenibacillus sp. 1_12]
MESKNKMRDNVKCNTLGPSLNWLDLYHEQIFSDLPQAFLQVERLRPRRLFTE